MYFSTLTKNLLITTFPTHSEENLQERLSWQGKRGTWQGKGKGGQGKGKAGGEEKGKGGRGKGRGGGRRRGLSMEVAVFFTPKSDYLWQGLLTLAETRRGRTGKGRKCRERRDEICLKKRQ